MSKQVTLTNVTETEKGLLVRTTLASEEITKVVVTCKGLGIKEFYPLGNNIKAYEAKELFLLAEILRGKQISPKLLQDFNKAYMDGYQRAYCECQKSIKESIDRLFNGD